MRRRRIVLGVASSTLTSVLRWQAAAPDRIIGGAQFDMGIPLPTVDVLRREIRAGRIGFLGEIGTQYLGLTPADSSLEPYYALAEELDVPVGIHTGGGPPDATVTCCPKFRAALGRPLGVEDVVVRHPKLRVSLMHAGYPYLDETIALMIAHSNVYADVAVLNGALPRAEFHAYLQSLMRAGLGARIMFGSDQMIWPEAIDAAIDGVDTAPFLSATEKRAIFFDNAAHFLRLDSARVRTLTAGNARPPAR